MTEKRTSLCLGCPIKCVASLPEHYTGRHDPVTYCVHDGVAVALTDDGESHVLVHPAVIINGRPQFAGLAPGRAILFIPTPLRPVVRIEPLDPLILITAELERLREAEYLLEEIIATYRVNLERGVWPSPSDPEIAANWEFFWEGWAKRYRKIREDAGKAKATE